MAETSEEKAARLAEWERVPTQEEIYQAIEDARRPALLLNKTKFADGPGEPGCWLGGEPTLPPHIDWPYQEVEGISSPLYFIVQINLARVPRSEGFPDVPETGTLFFFFDPTFWTTDAKVIYVDEDASVFPPTAMPDLPDVNDFKNEKNTECLAEAFPAFKKWNFDWQNYTTYFYEILRNRNINASICAAQQEEFWGGGAIAKERWSASEPGAARSIPQHYLFGCQQSRPLPNDDARLLLAIRADGDIGLAGGFHYLFWINEEDLETQSFHKAFLTKE